MELTWGSISSWVEHYLVLGKKWKDCQLQQQEGPEIEKLFTKWKKKQRKTNTSYSHLLVGQSYRIRGGYGDYQRLGGEEGIA